jgi:hypothetical protein
MGFSIPFVPNHWYYNTESGELTNGNNIENLGNNLVGGAGWHELNIPGSDTEAQAAAAAKQEFPTGKAPTTSITTGEANAIQQETGISNPLDYLKNIAGFFESLGERNTWIRVAKVLIGGVLVIAGFIKLTGAKQTAQSIVSKVPIVPV